MVVPAVYKFVNWITGTPVPIDDAITSALTPTIDTNLQNTLFANIPSLVPGLRLTLQTGQSVHRGPGASSATIFYTPHLHTWAPFWNGTSWIWRSTGGEISQTLADATKSPAAGVANTVYDMFLWMDGTTPRCTRGPAWTGVNTRSAGTALSRDATGNYWVNSVAITNGPAAGFGLYVGSIYTDPGGVTCSFCTAPSGSGGGTAIYGICNNFNRVATGVLNTDTGVAYTYTSNTVRQARASTANSVSFLTGLQQHDEGIFGGFIFDVTLVAAAGGGLTFGVGLNTTTAFVGGLVQFFTNPQGVNTMRYRCGFIGPVVPQSPLSTVGLQAINSLEQGDNVNANTINASQVNAGFNY